MTLKERIEGGFWGLLIGDALGVPYEFKQPHEIPPLAQIDFTPPAGYPRTYASIPPGTWSDDGAQALALLDSLLECDGLDLEDFANKMVAWQNTGKYAVGGEVFDIGVTTSRALSNFQNGDPPELSGLRDQYSNGNGSLMRALPLALWHQGDDAELVRDAMLQSLVTHGHLRSQVCCAIYCLWARNLLYGETNSFEKSVATFREILSGSAAIEELEFHIRPEDHSLGKGSGYVVDSLRSARDLLQHDSYVRVVKSAVALGYDTDTTACIAGGLAGIRDGVIAIPVHWRETLRGQEIAAPVLANLLKERAL